MAEIDRSPQDLRTNAILEVTAFIAGEIGGRSLPLSALPKGLAGRFDHAWSVPISTSDGRERMLLLLADETFPYEPPRLALAAPPPSLTWPHVETDGLLCLHESDVTVSAEDPVAVVEGLLRRVRGLLDANGQAVGVQAFREEFLSYWDIAAADDGTFNRFVSLVEPCGPSRFVAVWRHGGQGVVAESDGALNAWLRRMNWIDSGANAQARRGLLVWLPRAIIPVEYPATAIDVRQLVARLQSDETSRLVDLVTAKPDSIDVLLGMGTPNGACFAMVSVARPKPTRGRRKSADPLTRGFRPDRVPRRVLLDRYFTAATRIKKTAVRRADHAWVHGRDHDPQQAQLRQKRVAVVGCGSLGGPVALLLAQAGVGNLLLIDPDSMKWENLSRHTLGAESVGQNKAEALAKRIRSAHPHLGDVTGCPHKLTGAAHDVIAQIRNADLILEATGVWSASNLLNDLQNGGGAFPPVIYAWLEAAASAAHVVVPQPSSGCLRCGFESDGYPRLTVTRWHGDHRAIGVPECGGVFTPYGAVELTAAHALVLDAVMAVLLGEVGSKNHRIWIGARDRIASFDGDWSDEWVAAQGDPGDGCLRVYREWSRLEDCAVCGN